MNYSKKIVCVVALSASFLFACKKTEIDTESQSATDNSICEAEFNKMLPTVNNYATDFQEIKKTSNCEVISIDSLYSANNNYWPKKLTIDYGNGCTGNDGKVRRGKLTAELSNRWSAIGTITIISLTDYYVNDLKYEGTVTITRNSANSLTKTVSGGKAISANWTLLWTTTQTITYNDGGTLTTTDDIHTIEAGSTNNGTNRENKTYSALVTKALVKNENCNWISSGTYELTPQGLNKRTIDFGDGLCDNKATLTIENNSFTFSLN